MKVRSSSALRWQPLVPTRTVACTDENGRAHSHRSLTPIQTRRRRACKEHTHARIHARAHTHKRHTHRQPSRCEPPQRHRHDIHTCVRAPTTYQQRHKQTTYAQSQTGTHRHRHRHRHTQTHTRTRASRASTHKPTLFSARYLNPDAYGAGQPARRRHDDRHAGGGALACSADRGGRRPARQAGKRQAAAWAWP